LKPFSPFFPGPSSFLSGKGLLSFFFQLSRLHSAFFYCSCKPCPKPQDARLSLNPYVAFLTFLPPLNSRTPTLIEHVPPSSQTRFKSRSLVFGHLPLPLALQAHPREEPDRVYLLVARPLLDLRPPSSFFLRALSPF